MTVAPVIARELRAQSRNPFTYWVRVLGASALIAATLIFGLTAGMESNNGGSLFRTLHITLFISIWLFVPLLTANCISQERRQGTLPLLFLTLLKPRDIVIAKSFAHMLRAVSLCVAVIPIMTICFLMGGVGWRAGAMSLFINFSALLWAVGAGILASSLHKAWARSVTQAFVFNIVFFGVLCFCMGLTWKAGSQILGFRTWEFDIAKLVATGIFEVFTLDPFISDRTFFLFGTAPSPTLARDTLVAGMLTSLLTIAGFLLTILIAARNVRRRWQDLPPSAWQVWCERKFCQPMLMQDLLRRWMKFKLDRNPIGWLEVRSWSGRLVIWTWFAVMVSALTIAFWDSNLYSLRFQGINTFMGWLLAWSIASSAASSFQRERESGVLELLLVAPLKVGEIINGRLRGLWGQFFPAIALLLGIWLYWLALFTSGEGLSRLFFFTATFATLPVIGLFCSLRSKNYISAILQTLLVGILFPIALPSILSWFFWKIFLPQNFYGSPRIELGLAAGLIQVALAIWLWFRMHRNLSGRKFSLERVAT